MPDRPGASRRSRLARAGARVLLVDRARFPRDKLCGDTLNPGALGIITRLGVGPAVERDSIPLDGMLVTGEGGVAVRACFGPGITGRAISRRLLDGILLRAAVDAGAQFQDRAVVQGPIVERVRGVMRVVGASIRTADGRTVRLPASVTIAADGRRSSLAIALGLARQPRRPRRWAVGAYYTGVSGLGTIGEMHIRAGHYVGIAPLGAGLANICLVTPRRAGFDRPEGLHERHVFTDPQLADRFAGARRVSRIATLGPLAVDARAAGVPGLLLAGDAAGFVDPMTGDGLSLAMRGAELAAELALTSLTSPGFDAAAALAERRARTFGRKMRVNRALRALVSSEAAIRAAGFGARMAPGVLRSLIRYEADIPSDIESTTGLAAEMREVPWRP